MWDRLQFLALNLTPNFWPCSEMFRPQSRRLSFARGYQGQHTLVSPATEQPQHVQGGLPSCRVLRIKLSCPGASRRLGGCAHLGSAPSVPPARGTEVKGQTTVAARQRQVVITSMCRSVRLHVQARRCAASAVVGDWFHVQAAMAWSGGALR